MCLCFGVVAVVIVIQRIPSSQLGTPQRDSGGTRESNRSYGGGSTHIPVLPPLLPDLHPRVSTSPCESVLGPLRGVTLSSRCACERCFNLCDQRHVRGSLNSTTATTTSSTTKTATIATTADDDNGDDNDKSILSVFNRRRCDCSQ